MISNKLRCAAAVAAACFGVYASYPVWAQDADTDKPTQKQVEQVIQPAAKLQLYPSRIELKPGDNSAEINVINGGTATGQYRMSLQDMAMPEDGVLQPVPEGQEGPFSLKPYVRATPRSVTVPAGQSQKFRLMVRLPRDLPAGEYRTHAHVLMTADNVVEAPTNPDGQGVAIGFKPRFRFSVPVSITVGEVTSQASIESMQLKPANPNNPDKRSLDVWFTHAGNGSARGDLKVIFTKGGQAYELMNLRGYMIYAGVAKRRQDMTLDVPQGVALEGGTLTLTFTKQGEGGGMIAEKTINL